MYKRQLLETATLERDDGNHAMMQAVAGTRGVFPTYVPAEQRRYNVFALHTGVKALEVMQVATGKLDYSALLSDVAACAEANALIVACVVDNPGRKFIILSRLVAHAKALSAALVAAGVTSDTMVGNAKSHRDVRALVGTAPKIGTGYDLATFCRDFGGTAADTLILTHSVKKWQQFEQFRGRVMRAAADTTPAVISMISDNGIITRHFGGLKAWIKKTGGVVTVCRAAPVIG